MSISDKEDRTYLYVTDYTSRPDLVPVHVDSQITRVLENNQILKIALFDENLKRVDRVNWATAANSTVTPQCGYGVDSAPHKVVLSY